MHRYPNLGDRVFRLLVLLAVQQTLNNRMENQHWLLIKSNKQGPSADSADESSFATISECSGDVSDLVHHHRLDPLILL